MAHRYVYEKGPGTYLEVDKKLCRASVPDNYGVGSHQCVRKAKVFDKEGLGWCTQHSPEKDAARKAKASAKYENWAAGAARLSAMKAVGQAYVEAREAGKTHKTAAEAAKAAYTKVRDSLCLEPPAVGGGAEKGPE